MGPLPPVFSSVPALLNAEVAPLPLKEPSPVMSNMAPARLLNVASCTLIVPDWLHVRVPPLSISRPFTVTELVMLLVPLRIAAPVPPMVPPDQARPPLSVTVPVLLSVPPEKFHCVATTTSPAPVSVPFCNIKVPAVNVLLG